MRVTDDRYSRDRQRFDLAMRMILHEARTCTIRAWTGLSDDRIRKLYRSYVASHGAHLKRHRGKAPTQTAYFMRNAEARRHTAGLAGLFAILGLLEQAAREQHPGGTLAALRSGELFCRTYETYAAFYRTQRLSFEHASHLLHLLRRSAELRPGRCPVCDSYMVVDVLRPAQAVCTWCETDGRRSGAAADA